MEEHATNPLASVVTGTNAAGTEHSLRAVAPARTPPAHPQEVDDLHVAIGKRIFAQMDMIVMASNTINSVFAISAAISLIPEDFGMGLEGFCVYGSHGLPLSIGVQCPYLPSPGFIVFLTVWTVYFATIFAYRYHRTIDYWTNDLRFYVACDMLHNDVFIRILAFVGIVLTIGSVSGGLWYVDHNGSDASLGNLFVFVLVNMFNLKGMIGGKMTAVNGESRVEVFFQEPIFIRLPTAKLRNLYGICMSHSDALASVFAADTVATHTGNDAVLAQVGDVKKLRAAVLLLMPAELKVASSPRPSPCPAPSLGPTSGPSPSPFSTPDPSPISGSRAIS